MKAIVIASPGGPEVLTLCDVPTPSPSKGEVRVRVRASAVNRADLLQRMGAYPAPPDSPRDIPGLELAGEVDAVGEGVTRLAVGDRVFGLVGGGAYAEHVTAHERTLAKMPPGLSFIDAAAIPEAFITAYDAMVTQAGLAAGETVLVSAVGSGVGTAAVQIARAIGCVSVGTSRTADKLERAMALGMSHGLVVSKDGKFAEEVRAVTDGRGVHVALELVGGAYLAEDVMCLVPQGRLVLVGLLAGTRVDLDLAAVLRKRLRLFGTVLRARPLEEKIQAAMVFERHVVPLVAKGVLRAVVDRVFPLGDAGASHAYVATNDGFGKVVLQVD
jgi:putative PIG3 family NAD(P)H quinone oxidoreductase